MSTLCDIPKDVFVKHIVDRIVPRNSVPTKTQNTIWKSTDKTNRLGTYVTKKYVRSPYYNYCLVSKDFNRLITFSLRDWIHSFSSIKFQNDREFVSRCAPMVSHIIYQIRDWYDGGEIYRWIQPKSFTKKYLLKANEYKIEDFDIIDVKRIVIQCSNSFERKTIHCIANMMGLHSKRFGVNRKTTNNYHQEFEGWTSETNCDGCTKCECFVPKIEGVIVSDREITIRPDLARIIGQHRNKLGL